MRIPLHGLADLAALLVAPILIVPTLQRGNDK